MGRLPRRATVHPVQARWAVLGLGPLLVTLALVAPSACGTDAVAVDACRQIEEARCRQAPACSVDMSRPKHRDNNDVEACINHYRDACLHGFVTPADPGGVAVQKCVDAINSGNCGIVLKPETSPDCAFLLPPPPTPATTDAGTDADDAGG